MIISGVSSLAAGGFNPNVLAGQYIEILPHDGILQFGLTSDEPAATIGNTVVDILLTTDIIARQVVPTSKVGAPQLQPIYPDDYHLSHPALSGERIFMSHQNKGAATQRLFWSIMFDKT